RLETAAAVGPACNNLAITVYLRVERDPATVGRPQRAIVVCVRAAQAGPGRRFQVVAEHLAVNPDAGRVRDKPLVPRQHRTFQRLVVYAGIADQVSLPVEPDEAARVGSGRRKIDERPGARDRKLTFAGAAGDVCDDGRGGPVRCET